MLCGTKTHQMDNGPTLKQSGSCLHYCDDQTGNATRLLWMKLMLVLIWTKAYSISLLTGSYANPLTWFLRWSRLKANRNQGSVSQSINWKSKSANLLFLHWKKVVVYEIVDIIISKYGALLDSELWILR